MLILFFAALIVSISLTVILFSVMGRSVYAKVIGSDMLQQARSIAEETRRLMQGELGEDMYKVLLRGREASVVVLDSDKRPVIMLENMGPKDGISGRPAPEGEPDPGFFGKMESYRARCADLYDAVVSDNSASDYMDTDTMLGVVAAVPVMSDDNEVIGAVFVMRPMEDISNTSKSLLIVLVLAASAVGLVMVLPIFFIARRLTDPLKNLTSTAAELSEGDLAKRARIEGANEVRELGDTLNTLADNLQRTISELTVERNRLRAVLDGLGEGIIAFGNDGAVIQHNSSAIKLLSGRSEADITSLPAFLSVAEPAKAVLENGSDSVSSFERDGRVVRVSIAPIEEENGAVAGAVALLMDVTEAERLEQTRRDYVANVSHELRTPLASIRGIADMLNDGLVKNESDKQRYYGSILKESIRLSTLINDLLELSRLQSGGVALKLYKMELYELIADVADRMTEPASKRGMSIDINVPEGKYYARSNPDRIEQVMVSLLDNAVKHGEEGGSIAISLEDRGDKWEFCVSNPAVIESRDVEHLFERFYKADVAHTGEGTGLGLAITEEVLRLMGESIRADYENGVISFTFTIAKDGANDK